MNLLSNDIIKEIIFSEYSRTFLLCTLSVAFAFFMRNRAVSQKVFLFVCYEFIVCFPFLWILILCVVMTEFNHESFISIAKWGGQWIFYFTIIEILQLGIYSALWKKNKPFKIIALFLCIIIVIAPLTMFDFR